MKNVEVGDKIYIELDSQDYEFTVIKHADGEYGLLNMDDFEVSNYYFSSIDNLVECLMNSCIKDKFKIETKHGEEFYIEVEEFQTLEVGDYAIFENDYSPKKTIGRIYENLENEYVMTFPINNITDYVAYESIQDLYNFWKDAYDEVKWIRVKEKDSLVPKWNCDSRYFLFDKNDNEYWIVGKENCPEIYHVDTGETLEEENTEGELLEVITSKYMIFEEIRDY